MIKNKSLADILFWIIAFFSFLPFIILSFFTHPGKEDYHFDAIFKQLDFWQAQHNASNWSGRFFANALLFVCVRINVVSSYYFLFSLLLFVFTLAAASFLA